LWIPVLKSQSDWFGYEVSLLDAGRLSAMAAGVAWLLRSIWVENLTLPRNPLLLWTGGLVAWAAFTLVYDFDPGRGRNETLRLVFNLLLMLIVAAFAGTPRRVQTAAATWVAVGCALSLVA